MAHESDELTIRVNLHIHLPLWDALKLRLAGADYTYGYMQHMLETYARQTLNIDHQDEGGYGRTV